MKEEGRRGKGRGKERDFDSFILEGELLLGRQDTDIDSTRHTR